MSYKVNSLLAKLLAKEDITVQHGNYSTAWFDVKNRILGLPNWKNMGKDVYDMLVGHEVGQRATLISLKMLVSKDSFREIILV
jgi:hypothetical protein